jgi:uncharacterized protein YjiS (DUF1127 family)
MTTASMLNSLYHCGFCAQISAFADAWKQHMRNRDGARQLEAMSDHALKDIGLTRGDIPAVRRGELTHHYRGTV